MFCDGCGASLSPSSQFCSSCGKPVIPSTGLPVSQPVARAYSDERVKRNITALTTMWLVYGILRVLSVVTLFTMGRIFLPWMMGPHGWPMGGGWAWEHLVPLGLYTGGAVSAIFAAAYLFLAWGLYERQPWARTLGIVLSFFVLLRIPLGTALGIYTLWVLLPDPSRREYEQIAHA